MKQCVACAEEIQDKAVLCRFCGTRQDNSDFEEALDESMETTTSTQLFGNLEVPNSLSSSKKGLLPVLLGGVTLLVAGAIFGALAFGKTTGSPAVLGNDQPESSSQVPDVSNSDSLVLWNGEEIVFNDPHLAAYMGFCNSVEQPWWPTEAVMNLDTQARVNEFNRRADWMDDALGIPGSMTRTTNPDLDTVVLEVFLSHKFEIWSIRDAAQAFIDYPTAYWLFVDEVLSARSESAASCNDLRDFVVSNTDFGGE